MYMCIVLSLNVQDGVSPLYAASQEGHTEIVDLLVRAGADINQATTKVHTEVTEYFGETVFKCNQFPTSHVARLHVHRNLTYSLIIQFYVAWHGNLYISYGRIVSP